MKSLTPEQTIRRLGWKAARQSLKETRGITAPHPPHLSWHLATHYPNLIWPWFKQWLGWPLRTVQFWVEIWKHSRKDFVKEYEALAKQGVPSREIFRQTKLRMHLTEDEISEQGRKIFAGYTRGQNVGEIFPTQKISGGGFPTKISPEQLKRLR
jgi:hypothetical protein